MDPQGSEHRRCYCYHALARDSGISKVELWKIAFWTPDVARSLSLAQILVRTEKMTLLVVKLKNSCNFVSFAPIELRLRLRKVDFFHLGTFFHRHFIFKNWLGPDPCPEVAWPRSLVQRRDWPRSLVQIPWLGPDPWQDWPDPCPDQRSLCDQSVFETLDVWKVIKKSADIHFFAKIKNFRSPV